MKKVVKIIVGAAMMAGLAQAEVVFDLGAQQFYYPITKLKDSNGDYTIDQFREASYDTGKAVASTGLTSANGYYRPESSRTGYFGVQIKEPKVKSSVIFGMYCYLYYDGCSVQLLGQDGGAVNINFSKYTSTDTPGAVSVNGETQYGIGNGSTDIDGAIDIDSSGINITINGKYKFTVNKTDFKLVKINFSLYTENSGRIYDIDKLTSLTISNND